MVKFLSSIALSVVSAPPTTESTSSDSSIRQDGLVLFHWRKSTTNGSTLQSAFTEQVIAYMESKGFKKQQQTEEDKDDVLNWNSAETAKRGAVSFTLSQSSHINNNGTILHVEKETEGDQPLRIECRMSHARPFQWILNQTEKQHQQKYNDTRRPLFCVTQSFQIDMQREEEAAAASNDDVEMEWWGIPVSLTHPTAVRQGIVSSFIEDAVDGEKAVVELVGVHGWVTLGAWLKEIGYKIGLEPKYGA